MKRAILILILGAALLLGYNAFAASPLYPEISVPDYKADAAVWVICVAHGFTYDDGSGNEIGLDVTLLTFDSNGDPDWTSVASAGWPVGQETAMRNFYKNWLNSLIKQVAGQAAYIGQNIDLKTPEALSGGF